jgi:hypothetical protein
MSVPVVTKPCAMGINPLRSAMAGAAERTRVCIAASRALLLMAVSSGGGAESAPTKRHRLAHPANAPGMAGYSSLATVMSWCMFMRSASRQGLSHSFPPQLIRQTLCQGTRERV